MIGLVGDNLTVAEQRHLRLISYRPTSEDILNKKFLTAALWAGLATSLVTPAFSQMENTSKNSKPQKSSGAANPANAPKKSIPPRLIKECESQLAGRLGPNKIVGPFFETKFAGGA